MYLLYVGLSRSFLLFETLGSYWVVINGEMKLKNLLDTKLHPVFFKSGGLEWILLPCATLIFFSACGLASSEFDLFSFEENAMHLLCVIVSKF